MTEITEAIARKVLETVDAGLVNGMGEQKPGAMCVEAAVCYALGLPHSDRPPCVGEAVRMFKITLNDSAWSSDAARAKGMRHISIAQLGSNKIDQSAFTGYVALETVRRILPIALRAAGVDAEIIARCEDLKSARAAANAAASAAANAADAADAAAYAAYASTAAANAAANAAAALSAAASAARAAAYAAAAAAYAARAAANAADAADAAAYAANRDEVLTLAANIATEALISLGCEGTQWLYLTTWP